MFDVYPTKLFDGAKQRLTILITSGKGKTHSLFATKYNRWKTDERDTLMQNLQYRQSMYDKIKSSIPKIGNDLSQNILSKIEKKQPAKFSDSSKMSFYVHRIPYNFVKAINFTPHFWNEVDGKKKSEDYKPYSLLDKGKNKIAIAFLSSNLFFWWWYLLFEGYHCGRHEIYLFPMGLEQLDPSTEKNLNKLADDLMHDLNRNKSRKKAEYKNTGKVEYDEFYPRLSKPIIDEIDRALARHYGLTDEELDFIINYDVKYRMGASAGEEGDSE